MRLGGRVLQLAQDRELIRRQFGGADLPWDPSRPLVDNISTDEITPGWVCFFYDETLAEYCLVGLRDRAVEKDEVRKGGFQVVVSGSSKGCGSSRETAPYSEYWAGVRLVVARSIEKIYAQNCQNIGLLASTDLGLVPRVLAGEEIPLEEFTRGLDPISRDIVEYGGLFNYNRARLRGEVRPPAIDTAPRPMTLAEKILARQAIADAGTGTLGVAAVQPGDALFVRTSIRFSHDYVTPMAEALFKMGFGGDARVAEPETVFAFRDHLTFIGLVMPEAHRRLGLLERAEGLAVTQKRFTDAQGIRLYGDAPGGGSEAICHNAVLEDLALPGDVVAGTDSHTCTAGALGAFAFGVGSTDMANAWFTRDVRVAVPETVRFELRGRLRPGVAAKDLMLHLMAFPYFKEGQGIGKVLEFGGDGIAPLSVDERATLTNMAVEAGAFTGIIEADERVVDYLVRNRDGLRAEDLAGRLLRSDPDAAYARVFGIDLGTVPVMVALPGDPRNGVPIDQVGVVPVDIAYGGSCTGGKMEDMDMYASVLRRADERGQRVQDGVSLYIQFGSQKIKRYAEQRGYVDLFRRVGAQLIDPSCGACIKAGPGVSDREDQVTVSAINRNFPGRSGPGRVYLASPRVVAASAIAGRIVDPDTIGG